MPSLHCTEYSSKILYKMIKNTPNLRQLAVAGCFSSYMNRTDEESCVNVQQFEVNLCNKETNNAPCCSVYNFISKLRNLRRLTMEVHPETSGSFLQDVRLFLVIINNFKYLFLRF